MSMELPDHDTCYQAISRRDARFDGRFYTGVTSTGIFCRPSCPARTPKAANVRFFPQAATASEAGFRPCRRCRPELAPGHPEWNRRADLTGRALTLIETGLVDRVGVGGLAAELGVSERHLRRELTETVGTGPLQLARARRLWLARLLLDQTTLPITEVAFASGFSSIRQFNDSIRAAFDAPPSALRRRVSTDPEATSVTLQLPARGELGWASLHRFLATRAIPGVEEVAPDGGFRRQVGGGQVELAAGPDPTTLTLRCALDDLGPLAELVPLIRRVADLDTDLDAVADHLAGDPVLASRLEQVPLGRLPGAFDPFEVGIRAVVGQQISVAGARTLLGRLVALTGVGPSGFPTPEQVAAADLDELGMPARRRQTIQTLARAVADGDVRLGPHVDPDEASQCLQSIAGIGPWTAGYITMRALGHPDGWPPNDLGLRRSLGVTDPELEARAQAWRPWRAYAALLLWQTDPTQPTPRQGASDD